MTTLRRRFAPLLPAVLALLLALAAVGCGAGPPAATTPSGAPGASSPVAPTPVPTPPASLTAAPVPQPLPPGATEVQPSSPPRSVGDAELITVFTHCGFEGRLDWAGSFWRELRRVPPGAAIGDPEDSGRITLLSPTDAVFESSTGVEVLLERVPGPVTLFPCD